MTHRQAITLLEDVIRRKSQEISNIQVANHSDRDRIDAMTAEVEQLQASIEILREDSEA